MPESVVFQIRTVSDGTLATVTGETKYDVLDAIRNDWMLWYLERPGLFGCWQDAWTAYAESSAYERLRQAIGLTPPPPLCPMCGRSISPGEQHII